MTGPHNPYAAALDGLVLEDPVAAFFDFCRERERIRTLRESGEPPPWSSDPVLQRGRFLNVFREDDRGTRALMRFAAPVADDLPTLIHALFFARWCNRQTTLDALSADLLADPAALRRALDALPDPPWCNVTAYPVEPVRWDDTVYSRFETATTLLARIAPALTAAICDAEGDVVRATRAVNAMFGMSNDFPIFMAVMDLAWFRPEVIDPTSHVPTGIGAVAFLDRLQRHLGLEDHEQTCDRMIALQAEHWPEARRGLQPIDIEYLSCECRKYYSYVNGTKAFEGKNVFSPGETPRVTFDIPPEDVPPAETPTRIHVIAGGPCSGKTTLLRALAETGHRIESETAETLLRAGIAAGRTAEQLRSDPVRWQLGILRRDYELFDGLPDDEVVFTDTSFVENLHYAARAGVALGPNIWSWLRRRRYARVFVLDPLDAYEQTAVRVETHETALETGARVSANYVRCGYDPVVVPCMPVAERVAFIEAALRAEDSQPAVA